MPVTVNAEDLETKVKEIIGGKVFWWRYLCDVHLEEEYAPWLRLMRR